MNKIIIDRKITMSIENDIEMAISSEIAPFISDEGWIKIAKRAAYAAISNHTSRCPNGFVSNNLPVFDDFIVEIHRSTRSKKRLKITSIAGYRTGDPLVYEDNTIKVEVL